jgi:hypothetical protein
MGNYNNADQEQFFMHLDDLKPMVPKMDMKTTETESMRVLDECRAIMVKKSNDYQNPNSNIRQADYYPNGCLSILDAIHAKTLRIRSVMEAMTNDTNYKPNFESLEDSAKDLINYCAFFVAYSRGKIDGQTPDRDWLNKKIVK